MPDTEKHPRRRQSWLGCLIATPVFYILSSGPVMASACWLREATHCDQFYVALWLYYPLIYIGRGGPLVRYIEWWFDLLGTVGPG